MYFGLVLLVNYSVPECPELSSVFHAAAVPLFTRQMGSWKTSFVTSNTAGGGSSSTESLVFTYRSTRCHKTQVVRLGHTQVR